MSEEMLITYCSPTLAKIKTGNLFSCRYSDKDRQNRQVRAINRKLGPKGVCLIPVYINEERVLMYLYRPDMLKADMADEKNRNILSEAGYPDCSSSKCLAILIKKLQESDSFPHEIGLFLGYPPEDVEGFITKGSREALYSGVWKVYHNVEQAVATFEKYRKCNAIYKNLYQHGKSLEELTVAD